jgi:hypothetical protein
MNRLAALAALSLTATGCIRAVDKSWNLDADGVTVVQVQADRGDVTIVADLDHAITTDIEYGGLGFGSIGVERDGVLVDARCDGLDICGGHVEVHLPSEIPVELILDAGNIEAYGLAAPIRLTLGAGDAHIGSYAGDDLDAALGAGNIDVDALVAPSSLRVDVGAGDALLMVPSGAYVLDLDVAAAHQVVQGVTHDPSAPGLIDVHLGTGAVVLTGQ